MWLYYVCNGCRVIIIHHILTDVGFFSPRLSLSTIAAVPQTMKPLRFCVVCVVFNFNFCCHIVKSNHRPLNLTYQLSEILVTFCLDYVKKFFFSSLDLKIPQHNNLAVIRYSMCLLFGICDGRKNRFKRNVWQDWHVKEGSRWSGPVTWSRKFMSINSSTKKQPIVGLYVVRFGRLPRSSRRSLPDTTCNMHIILHAKQCTLHTEHSKQIRALNGVHWTLCTRILASPELISQCCPSLRIQHHWVYNSYCQSE